MVDEPALPSPVLPAVPRLLSLGLLALQLLVLHVELPQLARRPVAEVRDEALKGVHPLHAQVDGAQILSLVGCV